MKLFKSALYCLLLLSFTVSAQDQGKAKIVTSFNKAAKCISPVEILKIDGREVNVQKMGFKLDPGKHTLSGRALIDTSFCQTVGPASRQYKVPPLEAEFEAGKTYWVGIDHSARNRKDWKYVVWKVED